MKDRLLAVAVGFLVALAVATSALAADPFVGTWKLNPATYKGTGAAPKSVIMKIEAQENGIKVVVNTIHADGRVTHQEYGAQYDGKDYPYIGSLGIDTVAINRIDPYTIAAVVKKGKKEVGSGRMVISQDGKSMTRTLKGKNAQGQESTGVGVLDKQ